MCAKQEVCNYKRKRFGRCGNLQNMFMNIFVCKRMKLVNVFKCFLQKLVSTFNKITNFEFTVNAETFEFEKCEISASAKNKSVEME